MQNNISISVLMPVYNGSHYIKEAIESILAQTFEDFEFIIINDGSTDDWGEKILQFTDKRILLINNEENKGLIHTINKGIDIAKGKYIARMDADDISLPDRLKEQFLFMEANTDIGAAGCEYYSLQGSKLKKKRAFTDSEVLRTILMFNTCLCHPATIIRKDLLTKHGIRYDSNYIHAEDYDLWIQLSKHSKLGNVKKLLFKYRQHAQQVTTIFNPGQKDSAGIIRLNYLKYLGFNFTDEDFKIHTIVATNQRITSENILNEIETWFLKLISQNDKLKSIEPTQFNFFLGKQWYDCCGNTSLGLAAYKRFFASALKNYFPLTARNKAKLAGKCIIRADKSA